jgi:phosphopantetheinyl transferase
VALFYQHNINETTRLAIWAIEEEEDFFLEKVPISRNIIHPHKRLQHLAGRYLLQWMFPDFPYGEILIADTKKPFLPNEQYHFSISHCGNFAAAIASRNQRVGIDIEISTPRVFKIVHKFLSEKERADFGLTADKVSSFFQNTSPNFRIQTLNGKLPITNSQLPTLLWSAKEALFKWWGWGDVDFSEMLPLQYFEMQQQGTIASAFKKGEWNIPLEVQYRIFEQVHLCWVNSSF